MDNQIILACDDQGNFLEYFPKEAGHAGKGRRHLAITVLVINGRGEMLLQRRKHKIFDNLWDFTASTHPLHKSDGTDETIEEATLRALKEEYGIENVSLKKVGEFNYFAQIGECCENEHDIFFMGEYNGEVNMDPSIGYEYKWMGKEEFLKDIEENPEKYTPWTKEATKFLQ